MTALNGEPHHLKLYNLPQRVEGGIKIHGFKGDDDKDVVLRFHHLDGMYSYCTVEGTDHIVNLKATTPLVEMEDGEYKIDEEAEEKTY